MDTGNDTSEAFTDDFGEDPTAATERRRAREQERLEQRRARTTLAAIVGGSLVVVGIGMAIIASTLSSAKHVPAARAETSKPAKVAAQAAAKPAAATTSAGDVATGTAGGASVQAGAAFAPAASSAPSSAGAADASATAADAGPPEPYAWAKQYHLIAHGLGAVGGLGVTNTREAFERNYRRGLRIFEVDLMYTRDDVLVARHDWSAMRFHRFGQRVPPRIVPTYEAFMAAPIAQKYHPLDTLGIIALMRRYPDAYVMTDVKVDTVQGRTKGLKQLVAAAKGNPDILSRIIVQIYEEGDFARTRVLGIQNVVYTFYRLKTTTQRALDFAEENDIRVVTVPVTEATKSLVSSIRRRGIKCAVHTVNDAKEAAALRRRGVALVYTDDLAPQQLSP